jgi:uncharacterized protein (UPF0147 family)
MKGLAEAISMLSEVCEDRTVPRNIRETCNTAVNILQDKRKELNVKVDSVRQLLDRVSEDPNIPMYTRTQIWNVVSLLESMLV